MTIKKRLLLISALLITLSSQSTVAENILPQAVTNFSIIKAILASGIKTIPRSGTKEILTSGTKAILESTLLMTLAIAPLSTFFLYFALSLASCAPIPLGKMNVLFSIGIVSVVTLITALLMSPVLLVLISCLAVTKIHGLKALKIAYNLTRNSLPNAAKIPIYLFSATTGLFSSYWNPLRSILRSTRIILLL